MHGDQEPDTFFGPWPMSEYISSDLQSLLQNFCHFKKFGPRLKMFGHP